MPVTVSIWSAKHLLKAVNAYKEFMQKEVSNYVVNRCKAIIVSEYLLEFTDNFERFLKEIKNEN